MRGLGLEGNELYRLSAAFRFANDQVVGRAQVEMTFHEGVGCVSEPAGGFSAGEPHFQELGWQRFASVGVSPPGTGSAEIRIALLVAALSAAPLAAQGRLFAVDYVIPQAQEAASGYSATGGAAPLGLFGTIYELGVSKARATEMVFAAPTPSRSAPPAREPRPRGARRTGCSNPI